MQIIKKILFVPIALLKYLRKKYYLLFLDEKIFFEEQKIKFEKFNLSREKGDNNLKKIYKNFDLKKSKMTSEHEIIFSSLSISDFHPQTILEIGTFDARNVKLLSILFDKSNITTIDLDEKEEDFKNFYDRNNEKKLKEFLTERGNNLKDLKNVEFIKKNSLKLINESKKYDLIWIDGAHGYPFITADIINSLKILNNSGIILCDDIFIDNHQLSNNKMYESVGGFQTLEELRKANILKFELFHKRLNKEGLAIPKKRKFIALVNKIS